MAKMTRTKVKLAAKEIISNYSATLKIEDDASVKSGKKKHLDPDIEPTDGWWVDCKVFVPKDHKDDI